MSELLALLELGSNAIRFFLARVTPGVGFHILRDERVQARLGGGRPGTLSREAIDLTLTAVHRFLAGVTEGGNGHGRPRVLAVATAAVRDAVNRDQLLDTLRRREGIDVQVLSGQEEGRLGAMAALQTLPIRDAVVADLGGGSLQITCSPDTPGPSASTISPSRRPICVPHSRHASGARAITRAPGGRPGSSRR